MYYFCKASIKQNLPMYYNSISVLYCNYVIAKLIILFTPYVSYLSHCNIKLIYNGPTVSKQSPTFGHDFYFIFKFYFFLIRTPITLYDGVYTIRR